MIPAFPEFVDVSLDNKTEIESYTNRFKPYSDFNFVSLYAWDTDKKRKVATLDDGLVVLMTDYDTNKPLLSFLGNLKEKSTAHSLIKYAKDLGIDESLHFIGEETISNIKDSALVIEEDRDNFDYIISIPELTELKGGKYANKRQLANKFEKEYPDAVFESIKLESSHFESHALPVLELSLKKGTHEDEEATHEKEAIGRLFQDLENGDLILSTVFIDGRLAGFSIDEILPNKYAISHFFKTDYDFKGISEFMNKKVSQNLRSLEAELWNWEQDMGLESLRKMKSGYRPVHFLKKYKISLQ